MKQPHFPEQFVDVTMIGAGGMGAVYKAREEPIGRSVAIKVMAADASSSEHLLQRFQREARALSKLKHPNVLRAHSFGVLADGQPYIVMEYVDGRPLDSEGKLEPQKARRLFIQIASALQYLHAEGIIHRDIKPANVLLCADATGSEVCKLVDFGIARDVSAQKLTATGSVIGSIAYASAEQITGQKLDERTDIYSLGCLMYECLTGQLPYPQDNVLAIMQAQANEELSPPSELEPNIPAGLSRIVMRCLKTDVDQRFQTAEEVVDALRTGDTTLDTTVPKPRSRRSRANTLVFATIIAALLISLAMIGFSHLDHQPEPVTPVTENLHLNAEDIRRESCEKTKTETEREAFIRSKLKLAQQQLDAKIPDARKTVLDLELELGIMQRRLGRFDEAILTHKDATTHISKSTKSDRGTLESLYYELSEDYKAKNDLPNYIAAVKDARSVRNPDHYFTLDAISGDYLFKQKHYDEAKKILLLALTNDSLELLDETTDKYHFQYYELAACEARDGNYKAALQYAQQAYAGGKAHFANPGVLKQYQQQVAEYSKLLKARR